MNEPVQLYLIFFFFFVTDIDECKTEEANCAHGCHNTLGSYACVCNTAYELGSDGKQCYSQFNVFYIITWIETLHLFCTRYFSPVTHIISLYKGIEMEIVNSCENNNGGCSHHCQHSTGGPVCSCNQGYRLDDDLKTCVGKKPRCTGIGLTNMLITDYKAYSWVIPSQQLNY